jgi:ABC-type antimicrobial peptide transport system permease subunit
MIRSIFKLLWNRRKSYLGIFFEQAIIVFVLMFCLVQLVQTIRKYTDPGLLDTRNTVAFGIDFRKTTVPDESFRKETNRAIINNMRNLPFVEAITNSYGLMPYMDQGNNRTDSVWMDGRKIRTEIKGADEYSRTVFRPALEEGVWLENKTFEDGSFPAVITRQLADKAGWTASLGKKIQYNGRVYTVTGVMEGLKRALFEPSVTAIVLPVSHFKSVHDLTVARIKNNEKDHFINALNKECKRLYPDHHATLLIVSGDMMKQAQVFSHAMGLILMSIPALFLTIFAFIGTFGVFYLHAKRHLKEYALRIALGSDTKRLFYLVISESLLVTCLAMLPALLLSVFLYDYADLTAILVTVGVMLLFSAVSAWYPAWRVSRVNPAEALQYE